MSSYNFSRREAGRIHRALISIEPGLELVAAPRNGYDWSDRYPALVLVGPYNCALVAA